MTEDEMGDGEHDWYYGFAPGVMMDRRLAL